MTRSSPPTDVPSQADSVPDGPLRDSTAADAPTGSDEGRDLSALLRETMAKTPGSVNVLAGVQQKLRERSGGKFYRDRWSTDRFAPIPTYLVTTTLMLVVVAVAYVILRPLSGVATQAPAPAPVRIIPPAQNR